MVCWNSPIRLCSSLALLSGKKCSPAMLTPSTWDSRGISWGRVSLSKPNWEGVPVIRMLVVALAEALLTRSRQSARTPCATAAAPTCSRSVGDSTEKVRTPLAIATASSPCVLPGPVYITSAPRKPATSAADSSPVEEISTRQDRPSPSRSARSSSGCGLALAA